MRLKIGLALLIHRNYRNERRMWRKAAIRFMILVARPIRGSIEERHTHHGRRYSPAVSTAVRKWPKTSGLKLLRRPQLSVDLMVANNGWTACPVKAVSRRRRGPKASLYRARRPAKLDHQGRREATLKRHAARQFQTGDFR